MSVLHRSGLLHVRPLQRARHLSIALFGLMLIAALAPSTYAAIAWDGGGGSSWWFDPANWNQSAFNYLPPGQDTAGVLTLTDAQINAAPVGEGVVYDPANDPFFANAATLSYPTGSIEVTPGVMRNYGPQTLHRFYLSRNTPNVNRLTIKSGDLAFGDDTLIGRSGSTPTQSNLGIVVQTGGTVRLPDEPLDIGHREASGPGNGTWDYQGGILRVQEVGGQGGIRLSAGSSGNGTGGHGRFVMHNPASGGYVRAFDMTFASDGTNGDGIATGVAIAEFHFENGGTRPFQIERNLSINNGGDSDAIGVRSARLELKLDAAPTLTAGVPQNLGLFDVDFGGVFGGLILGTGDLDGDLIYNDDRVFSNVAGTVHYRQGDTVSAVFGSTQYNWTLSYTGDITWTDPDTSAVSAVIGTGGTDVVLVGLSSETVAVDDADFDNDSDVDGNDFLIWQRGLGAGTNNATGDANGNSAVDGADLAIWKTQFGPGGPMVGAIGAVPEPAGSVLFTLAALAAGGWRCARA